MSEGIAQALRSVDFRPVGGIANGLTFLKWFRENRDIFDAITKGFDDFSNATTWRDRLAAIGGLIDAVGSRFVTVPTEIDQEVWESLKVEAAEYSAVSSVDAEFVSHEFAETAGAMCQLAIDPERFKQRLTKLIAFAQMIAKLVAAFNGVMPAADDYAVERIHGYVYQRLSA